MKRKAIYFLFVMILFMACHDTITTINGCCDEPASYATFGSGKIFVPNVFTPNADGVNDYLFIYGDSVTQISSLKIKNQDRVTVHEIFNIPVNDYSSAWDGEFAGKIEPGLYSFVLEAEAFDGTFITLEGKVCICPCVDGIDEDFVPLTGCEFGGCVPHWIHCPNEYLPCFEY